MMYVSLCLLYTTLRPGHRNPLPFPVVVGFFFFPLVLTGAGVSQMSVSTTQRYAATRAGMKILGLPCFTRAALNKLL